MDASLSAKIFENLTSTEKLADYRRNDKTIGFDGVIDDWNQEQVDNYILQLVSNPSFVNLISIDIMNIPFATGNNNGKVVLYNNLFVHYLGEDKRNPSPVEINFMLTELAKDILITNSIVPSVHDQSTTKEREHEMTKFFNQIDPSKIVIKYDYWAYKNHLSLEYDSTIISHLLSGIPQSVFHNDLRNAGIYNVISQLFNNAITKKENNYPSLIS